jgi:CIC family chloride channel protein
MIPVAGAMRRLAETVAVNLRQAALAQLPGLWLLAVAIGIVVAGAAVVFRLGISAVQYLWLGTVTAPMSEVAASLPWWAVLAGPTLGGLAVGLILRYALANRRAGAVADVMEAKALRGGRMELRVGLVSAAVSAITLGCGASAGREGPVVHLGATLGSYFAARLALPGRAVRTLLGCGVAAAIAASFNAPIAGVLFALEVILGHYALSAFVPIVIASVAATVVTRVYLGDFPAFVLPAYEIVSDFEFPAFALLGVVCAGVAVALQSSLIVSDRLAGRLPLPLWLRPVLGGAVVGAIGIAVPQVLGVGYEATDTALKGGFALSTLLLLLVVKTAATAITYASRFGGGIVSPALFLGAMTGGAFGIIAAEVFPELASSHGLYAMVGMGAVAAAVLGAPISTTLIVFELTGGLGISVALLLAVSVATGLTQAVHGRSFFEWQLETRGLSLSGGAHRLVMLTLKVGDLMRTPAEGEAAAAGAQEATLIPGDTLETALRAFDAAGVETIAVTASRDDRRIVGWADRPTALDRFNRALIEASVEEHR